MNFSVKKGGSRKYRPTLQAILKLKVVELFLLEYAGNPGF